MINYLLDLLLKQIFGQPFLLMAIVVLIGYIAMNAKPMKAIVGALKASVGILAMGMGSGALITNFGYLLTAVTNATGIQGAGLNTYPTMTAGYEKDRFCSGERNRSCMGNLHITGCLCFKSCTGCI